MERLNSGSVWYSGEVLESALIRTTSFTCVTASTPAASILADVLTEACVALWTAVDTDA